jgi:hypothetical protein
LKVVVVVVAVAGVITVGHDRSRLSLDPGLLNR